MEKWELSGEDQNIVSILQNNQRNLEFLYSICFDLGSGENVYKMQISQPKNDNEAFKKAQAKLNELQKGGLNGRCELIGREIRAGGKLKIKDINMNHYKFSIKSVSHSFNDQAYIISVEFEG